jgi:hypothetical protein
MTDQTPIEAATKRLALALDALDAAVERRIDVEQGHTALSEQVHALDADRSKLAADLDSQTARARRLEAVNRHIAGRLDAAMQNVRSVLDGQER